MVQELATDEYEQLGGMVREQERELTRLEQVQEQAEVVQVPREQVQATVVQEQVQHIVVQVLAELHRIPAAATRVKHNPHARAALQSG